MLRKATFYSIIVLLLFACLKENNSATTAGVAIPFVDTMGILPVLNKCGGTQCHSAKGKEESKFLYNPDDFERSIKKNIEEIYKQANTYGKGMASSKYANLSQAEITILKNWYDAGFPNGKTKLIKVAFTHSIMRPWFDAECASCHGVDKSNAAQWKYDPSDYSNSIKTQLGNIKNVTLTKKTMPPGKTLSSGEVQKLSDWINAGGPAID